MGTRITKILILLGASALSFTAAVLLVGPRGAESATAVTRSDEAERGDATAAQRLELSAAQAEQVDALRTRERRRIEALERALAQVEQELRHAELVIPFDAERVNALVTRRAELGAYLRGAESRMVAEIAALLTSEQREHFAALRESGAPALPRARQSPTEWARATGT
jgi:Spy/CpxP family protein refolding chaperone